MFFAVADAGVIKLRKLGNGKAFITHIGTRNLVQVVDTVCTNHRGQYDAASRRWTIDEPYTHEVIADLSKIALRVATCG